MDLSKYRNKLIGSKEERAVSPVIGVILMVAITVILAAVIAAFVLDMGSGLGSNANAGVDTSTDNTNNNVEVSVTDMGNAEEIILRGDLDNDGDNAVNSNTDDPYNPDQDGLTQAGEQLTLEFKSGESHSGTITVVAIMDDGTETQIGSQDYEFDPDS